MTPTASWLNGAHLDERERLAGEEACGEELEGVDHNVHPVTWNSDLPIHQVVVELDVLHRDEIFPRQQP